MRAYRVWLDDERLCPYTDYDSFHSVNEVKSFITEKGGGWFYLNLDHDLGKYAKDGGDAIELIKWILNEGLHENPAYVFRFELHTQNIVGRINMQALIDRYFKKGVY